jgi:diaminohydroxyphosphoribosylaminopyrimidine deaminase/5-amino-6-(5-phosphoribosylamino)uracil reductase
MATTSVDSSFMSQALDLAQRGRGNVEPNPLVGCVIVRNGQLVGQGYHQRFGGPHAEIEALRAAGAAARGAGVYVTLEPCCHQGQTGPCTQALIEAGVAQVVVGCQDPNPLVAGQGLAALRAAGIEVQTGLLHAQATQLLAPFTKLITTGRPWVIAKWAMTLDGKIAARNRSSQWISNEASRAAVHKMRGQVDAILVGRGTVVADDPRLTARPPGARIATRVVLDSTASLALDSQLTQSTDQAPLLVATTAAAPPENRRALEACGAEIVVLPGQDRGEQMAALLLELGSRQMTNLLVEGGSEVFGTLLDLHAIDEVHVFVAPKLIGGRGAASPIAGQGLVDMAAAVELRQMQVEILADNLHIHGYLTQFGDARDCDGLTR